MKVLVALDSFKGSLSSFAANAAAQRAIERAYPGSIVQAIPVSDGGEGWLKCCRAILGGDKVKCKVHDPLGRPISASYLRLNKLAIVEVAEACGMSLLLPEERNPMVATSRGVGELLVSAIDDGCADFVVGLGGSVTSDAGIGMLQVMVERFAPEQGLVGLSALSHLRFNLASDVTNPLLGSKGAAAVFSPQKGATPEMVEHLEERARFFACSSAERLGFDRSGSPGAGAAGGLGYAFMQYFDAKCMSGGDWILDACNFDNLLRDVSLVVVGEGAADEQTLMGKIPFRILERAKKQGVPTLLLAGKVTGRECLLSAGFNEVLCINPSCDFEPQMLRTEVAALRLEECLFNYLSTQPLLHS